MHDVDVTQIAVRKDDQVDRLTGDRPFELLLLEDRNALRIEPPGELRWVPAAGDARNLGRRERNDRRAGIVAVDHVEVVEVAPRGTKDEDTCRVHVLHLDHRAARHGAWVAPPEAAGNSTGPGRTRGGDGALPSADSRGIVSRPSRTA